MSSRTMSLEVEEAPQEPKIPQAPQAKCDRCAKSRDKSCHFNLFGKLCIECDRSAKACTINGVSTRELWIAFSNAVPHASRNWVPPVFSGPLPDRRSEYEKKVKEQKKAGILKNQEQPAQKKSTTKRVTIAIPEDDEDYEIPVMENVQKRGRGRPKKNVESNKAPAVRASFRKPAAQARNPRIEADFPNGLSRDFNASSDRRKDDEDHPMLDDPEPEALDHENNEPRARDIPERLSELVAVAGFDDSELDLIEAAHKNKTFPSADIICHQLLRKKEDVFRATYAQLDSSIFVKYEDTPARMKRMRALETGLVEVCIAQLDDDQIAEGSIPRPLCCNQTKIKMPKGPVNTAKASEICFVNKLSEGSPYSNIDADQFPSWYKEENIAMIVTVFEQTSPDSPTRWFIVRKSQEDDGCYEVAEVFTKQSPCPMFGEASFSNCAIPAKVNEWFVRRAGTDVVCVEHQKQYSVVVMEYYSSD